MARRRQDNPQLADASPFLFGAVPAPGQQRAREDATDPDTPDAIYNEQQRRRASVDPRKVTVAVLFAVAVVAIPITAVLPTHLFDYAGFDSSLAQMGASLGGRITALAQIGSGSAAGMAAGIYLCQIVAVAIAGAALALNGAVYQGALNNALASPSTLGVMSGATLGNVIYTMFVLFPAQQQRTAFVRVSEMTSYLDSLGPLEYFWLTQQRALCCIAGCAVVVLLVVSIAYVAGKGRLSKVGLLVSGQVFASIITSIIEMARYYLRDHGTEAQQAALRNVVGGNFEGFVSPLDVALLGIPVLVGLVIVLLLRNRLNLLAFGDDEARSMGLSVNATRNVVIVVCTVLTALVVSFCGSVGFVGFLVPHLARKLVGPDFRYYVPASLCLGAAYLTIAYYLMNMSGILQGSIGTFTSIIGVVFFAVMAIRQRARGNVDWL